MTTVKRMILENQAAIMTALISLVKPDSRVQGDLYYHAAKTLAYIGEPDGRLLYRRIEGLDR